MTKLFYRHSPDGGSWDYTEGVITNRNPGVLETAARTCSEGNYHGLQDSVEAEEQTFL